MAARAITHTHGANQNSGNGRLKLGVQQYRTVISQGHHRLIPDGPESVFFRRNFSASSSSKLLGLIRETVYCQAGSTAGPVVACLEEKFREKEEKYAALSEGLGFRV
eukprot:767349-Hanusia_phi.AAC.7